MPKKDISTGFDNQDAQDFLDVYQDAMPTYRKAKKDPATESPPTAETREELTRIPVTPDRTKEEDEYLKTFVETCPIDAFNKKGRQVMVVNEFRHKILKIQALFNEDLSIAQYVHNVLAQHFKDVEPILNSLYQKSKQF
ncbi:DUF3408 domain-containing protein [Muribaculum sp.]|uniref:DUF3408 domain-containing protein n=1 Tax=Muribaculaceae TaxID=2005473 RepID=UPI00258C2374|nr:DUF3408 domain-containing protein [Muribaculum sp.]MCX4278972.1 DUF3408 domain-containing protein [Muribaculum sp.]